MLGGRPTDPREPEIEVDKTTIPVTLDGGGNATDSFTISNLGDKELTWSITTTQPWLAVDIHSGTTPAGDATTISVICACPPGGPFSGHIKIVSDDADETNTWIQVDAAY